MKKKQRIGMVKITGTTIEAFYTDGSDVKLTRRQRDIFKNYKRNLLENITKEFGTSYVHVISDNFFIKKNEEIVYQV